MFFPLCSFIKTWIIFCCVIIAQFFWGGHICHLVNLFPTFNFNLYVSSCSRSICMWITHILVFLLPPLWEDLSFWLVTADSKAYFAIHLTLYIYSTLFPPLFFCFQFDRLIFFPAGLKNIHTDSVLLWLPLRQTLVFTYLYSFLFLFLRYLLLYWIYFLKVIFYLENFMKCSIYACMHIFLVP